MPDNSAARAVRSSNKVLQPYLDSGVPPRRFEVLASVAHLERSTATPTCTRSWSGILGQWRTTQGSKPTSTTELRTTLMSPSPPGSVRRRVGCEQFSAQ